MLAYKACQEVYMYRDNSSFFTLLFLCLQVLEGLLLFVCQHCSATSRQGHKPCLSLTASVEERTTEPLVWSIRGIVYLRLIQNLFRIVYS